MKIALLDLNDDCIYAILKQIKETTDQVKLAQTCHRLKNLIVHEWQKRFKSALNLTELNLEHTDLPFFFSTICNSIESITAEREIFKNHHSEDQRTWDLYFWRSITKCSNLKELKLRYLELKTGSQLALLSKLTTLDLECTNLSHDVVLVIFDSLKLKRLNLTEVNRHKHDVLYSFSGEQFDELEELQISLRDMCNSLYDIMHLKRLKLLTITTAAKHDHGSEMNIRTYHLDAYIMRNVIDSFGKRLYYFELWADKLAHRFLSSNINKMFHLQFLKIVNMNMSDVGIYAKYLTELRELCFMACTGLTDENLLLFVSNCHNLTLIDIQSEQILTDAFIRQSGEILLARNSSIRLQINVAKGRLAVDLAQNPEFIRLQSAIKLTNNDHQPVPLLCDIFRKRFVYKFLD